MFDLTEEQAALKSMAQDFADQEIAPYALLWDRERHFPVETLRKGAALGMAAICAGEQHGGSGLTRFDGALIFEALATGCPTISAFLSIHNLITWAIDRFGSDAQRKTYGAKLARMDLIASYCLTEPACGSDAAALTTRARSDGDDYVLDGVKQFISGAGASDLYLVMARTGGPGPKGISAILVEKGTKGLSFGTNERKMGWNAQPTAQVIFEGVRAPKSACVGEEGAGFKIAMAALDGGRVNIGACSLGGARSAMEKALAYAKQRKAFGTAIADFQAQQFRLADMAASLESARALLWRAAKALDAKATEATTLAAMAKRVATDNGYHVANEALQIFGGYGYFADTGIEKIVRDLRVHQILEGTNDIMQLIVARALLAG
jgi:alkylation response protein AidB-like acyl-CoA dehydrogenase